MIIIEFPCQCPQKWKQIDYNQLKMDYNITVFRGNKILFSSIKIDLFSLLWTLTMNLKYNRFFFRFTEMRISTHIKSFLRWYFCSFFILLNITPLDFVHLQVGGGVGLRWRGVGSGWGKDSGGGWVEVGRYVGSGEACFNEKKWI